MENNFQNTIFNFMQIKPKLSPIFIKSREQLFYKYDGNTVKRIADIVLRELI